MVNLPPQFPLTRRIVTNHDSSGLSTISGDSQQEATVKPDGACLGPLFSTDQVPVQIDQAGSDLRADRAAACTGSFFTTYDLPPKYEGLMHRTTTLDYMVVFRGTIVMTMEDGSQVTLNEGDTVVQQGTMHKWGNPSDSWARAVTVMIAAHPET